MRRCVALLLAMHLIGQWGLYRLSSGQRTHNAHALYCFCQNCPGEPFCCCGKGQTQHQKVQLSATCDQPATLLLTQNAERPMVTTSPVVLSPPACLTALHLEPPSIKPAEYVVALDKPPRLL